MGTHMYLTEQLATAWIEKQVICLPELTRTLSEQQRQDSLVVMVTAPRRFPEQ